MANKYRANSIWFDRIEEQVITQEEANSTRRYYPKTSQGNIVRFDSNFEYEVYQALTTWVNKSQIVTQYPVEIIPPGICYPKGKK
jgi:hypothetical protein